MNITPTDIQYFDGMTYVTSNFMNNYINDMLTVAVMCTLGGFGCAILMIDVIIPWLRCRANLDDSDWNDRR
jgi:hypothetical protein